jgi:hypothetical protein
MGFSRSLFHDYCFLLTFSYLTPLGTRCISLQALQAFKVWVKKNAAEATAGSKSPATQQQTKKKHACSSVSKQLYSTYWNPELSLENSKKHNNT